MSGSRDQILGRIRSNLTQAAGPLRESPEALEKRTIEHKRGIRPSRVDKDAAGLVDLFVQRAEKVNATVARVASLDDIPDALATYLANENLPAAFRMADNPDLNAVPWDKRPALEIKKGASDGKDEVGLSRAVGGVAETGTLLLASGKESPTSLNFLPETHVVMVKRSEIEGTYEDGWDMVRAKGALSRAVNFITGPSRTGDIEQTIYLGAHGPRRLHILLVEDDS